MTAPAFDWNAYAEGLRAGIEIGRKTSGGNIEERSFVEGIFAGVDICAETGHTRRKNAGRVTNGVRRLRWYHGS